MCGPCNGTQSDRKGCGSGHSLRSGPSNACLLFWLYVLAADVAMVILLQDLPEDMAASPAEKNVGAAGEVGHHSGNGEWTEQPVLVVLFTSQ